MKSVINHPIKVLATGFIVLVLLSLPLFWIRFICETSISTGMPSEATYVRIEPSGLVPPEIENDPNVARHSCASANIHIESPFFVVGIADYFLAKYPGGRLSNVFLFENDEWIYFDKNSGHLVCRYSNVQVMPDKSTRPNDVTVYIGPEGIAETPDKTLGRFAEPIVDGDWELRNWATRSELMAYDKQMRRFFKIDISKKTVIKGPELAKDVPYEPIQIGRLNKNVSPSQSFYLQSPQVKITNKDPNEYPLRGDYKPIIPDSLTQSAGPYLLVLDRTGRINLLDKKTLEFAGTACWHLPGPETYFGTEPTVTPKDLLDYEVHPMTLSKFYQQDGSLIKMTFGEPYEPEWIAPRMEKEYLGMFVTATSRDGTAMVLAVFDAKGNQIKTAYTRLPIQIGSNTLYLRSSKAAFWETPWAPVATISKYLAENLHPPALSLASCFTASAFEAGAGHRALFLLPNSFAAMVARDSQGNIAEKFFSVLGLMLPSIILAIWLAGRVSKNAALLGLSRNAQRWWMLGTLAFGLVGYITYRLCRPKVTLVTCANCGRPRRPDMDKCHHCGSAWHVPELIPPSWRVLDGAGRD